MKSECHIFCQNYLSWSNIFAIDVLLELLTGVAFVVAGDKSGIQSMMKLLLMLNAILFQ